jgi:hypothetical protein
MRPPRFTVRRMMVAVAIAGVLLAILAWVRDLHRRRTFYEAQAARYAEQEEIHLYAARVARADFDRTRNKNYRGQVVTSLIYAGFYRLLVEKYRHAARHPWESVEPDPPDPYSPDFVPPDPPDSL